MFHGRKKFETKVLLFSFSPLAVSRHRTSSFFITKERKGGRIKTIANYECSGSVQRDEEDCIEKVSEQIELLLSEGKICFTNENATETIMNETVDESSL